MYKIPNSMTNWIWRWHIIAGLITLPVILLLCITGSIYLFKSDVNLAWYQSALTVPEVGKSRLPLTEQMTLAEHTSGQSFKSVTLPSVANETTAFQRNVKGRAANQVRVNPYSGEVTGDFVQKETLMYTIRKLHGELLLDKPGTLVIELVASWFIVLLITGIYLWWPTKAQVTGLFSIRTTKGRRTFWRDLHAVGGFWLSLGMVAIIAGGMPWTDVFGGNLKWVQAQTDTGYPRHWNNARGLVTEIPAEESQRLSLDDIASLETVKQLKGKVTISFPQGVDGVYSVKNRSFWLADQQVLHIDQYSGVPIKHLNWDKVGILMDMRQFFMRLHQGEYGIVNWLIVLAVVLTFTLTTIASLVSYLCRKPPKHWGLPATPKSFRVDLLLMLLIALLAILFPLFGVSALLLAVYSYLKPQNRSRQIAETG